MWYTIKLFEQGLKDGICAVRCYDKKQEFFEKNDNFEDKKEVSDNRKLSRVGR